MAKKSKRIALNLTGQDAKLAEALRLKLIIKTGISHIPAVAVARLAYQALAEKEAVEWQPNTQFKE